MIKKNQKKTESKKKKTIKDGMIKVQKDKLNNENNSDSSAFTEKFQRNNEVKVISWFYRWEVGIVTERKLVIVWSTWVIQYQIIVDNTQAIRCFENELELLSK